MIDKEKTSANDVGSEHKTPNYTVVTPEGVVTHFYGDGTPRSFMVTPSGEVLPFGPSKPLASVHGAKLGVLAS